MDPGAGSILVQVVIAVAVGIAATVKLTFGRDGAIVLVHGDHGSRLYQKGPGETPLPNRSTPVSKWDSEQLNSTFSTLLAIRRPGAPAVVHTNAVPVQDFLWELVRKDFKGETRTEWAHYVNPIVHEDSLPALPDNRRALKPQEMLWADSALTWRYHGT